MHLPHPEGLGIKQHSVYPHSALDSPYECKECESA